jgi:PhnB protein
MRTINPWINFNGNAEEAFTFYKSVFGGEFSKIVRFKDLAGFKIGDNEANKIMTIALPIGKHNVLIANDIPEFMGRVNENENRSKISISAESREEAEKILKDYRQAERLKDLSTTAHGARMPACSEINMVLSGLLNLIRIINQRIV